MHIHPHLWIYATRRLWKTFRWGFLLWDIITNSSILPHCWLFNFASKCVHWLFSRGCRITHRVGIRTRPDLRPQPRSRFHWVMGRSQCLALKAFHYLLCSGPFILLFAQCYSLVGSFFVKWLITHSSDDKSSSSKPSMTSVHNDLPSLHASHRVLFGVANRNMHST